MKKNLFIFFLLMCVSGIMYAQNGVKTDIIPYRKGNLWGFSDRNKKIIIPCIYDEVTRFTYGMANVKKDRKYSLIDKKGRVIMPESYKEFTIYNKNLVRRVTDSRKFEFFNTITNKIIDIDNNFYVEEINDKYIVLRSSDTFQIIDHKGKKVVPITKKRLFLIGEKAYLAKISNNQWDLMQFDGKKIKSIQDEYAGMVQNHIIIKQNNKYGLLDSKGKEVLACTYDMMDYDPENGFIMRLADKYTLYNSKNKKTTDYQPKISPKPNTKYNSIGFHVFPVMGTDNMFEVFGLNKPYIIYNDQKVVLYKYDAVYKLDDKIYKTKLNDKFGIVDEVGKEIIVCKYDNSFSFTNGFASVSYQNKWGLLDKTGKEVIPCKYDKEFTFFYGEFASVSYQGKFGAIDKTGKEIISYKYDEPFSFSGEFASVSYQGKFGAIDKTGREIIPFKYDKRFNFFGEFAPVSYQNKWGAIDKTGREITPFKYDERFTFYGGFASVSYQNKWGVIDKIGKEIIPCKYDQRLNFYGEFASVSYQNKWGAIDKTGKEITSFKYDEPFAFSDDLAVVSYQNKWGAIDKTGKEIIPCKYDGKFIFRDGFSLLFYQGKWGGINEKNMIILPFKYDAIRYCGIYYSNEKYFGMQLKKKWGIINKSGKLIIPCIYDELIGEFENNGTKYHSIKARIADKYFTVYENGTTQKEQEDKIQDENGTTQKEQEDKIQERNVEFRRPALPTEEVYEVIDRLEVTRRESIGLMPFFFGYIDLNGTEYWED